MPRRMDFNEAGVRDAGDRGNARIPRREAPTSTRPACETPEIPGVGTLRPPYFETSTRPACETPEILASDARCVGEPPHFNEAGVRDAGDPVLSLSSVSPVRTTSTRPACETPEIQAWTGTPGVSVTLQRGRRARRRRSGEVRRGRGGGRKLQRGRRARRRRSASTEGAAAIDFLLQRGRRARRRRSERAGYRLEWDTLLQRGRRARRRRSPSSHAEVRALRATSTRPACETPEISRLSPTFACVTLLQRGRRARRRRSAGGSSVGGTEHPLQRGRRARRRRSSITVQSRF